MKNMSSLYVLSMQIICWDSYYYLSNRPRLGHLLFVFTYLAIILIFYELTNKNNVEILELKSTSFLIFQNCLLLLNN